MTTTRRPVKTGHPDDRFPYVEDTDADANPADACRRSAQIDREEADTLDLADERHAMLMCSAQTWEEQAARLELTRDGDDSLVEILAEHVHVWYLQAAAAAGLTSRISEWGEEQVVPYVSLSERAKDKDRASVRAMLLGLKTVGVELVIPAWLAA